MKDDPIAAAIAATNTPAPPLRFDITLSRTSGRAVVLLAPPDLDPLELIDLVSTIVGSVTEEYAKRSTRPSLVVASKLPT